ncbi:MAG: efflux RND transporter periplasmic adaptor subunit [Xanthobacteraceae bacterium]|jgi:multidrug efflux system membrane fusion protein
MKFGQKTLSRRLIYSLGAVVVLAIALAGVWRLRATQAPITAPPPVPVTAAIAARNNVPEFASELGTVQSIDSVAVQAQVNGPILKVEFAPGQDVQKGQELFLIDPRPYQAALDEQEAQLEHDEGVLAEAQVDLTRYQLLAEQNSIAKQQAEDQVYVVQQDKGTVQLDQANVETARINLQYCHVLAPVSGRVGVLLVDLGNLVGPNQSSTSTSTTTTTGSTGSQGPAGAMVMIEQTRPIYVSFNIPQNLLDQVKRGQAASPLEVDAYSQAGELLEKGKLTVIDNQVNTSTGTVLLQATFANAEERLWPGEFVRAKLILSIRDNAVTVPSQAVSAGPNGSYVYLIDSDNTVHRVIVGVIDRQGAIAVIAKGLSGGEKIVVDGQYRLDDGVKVEIQQMVESPVE